MLGAGDLIRGVEETKKIREMEQLRRQGQSFFKVLMRGDVKRVHTVKDICLDEIPTVDGGVEYKVREGDKMLEGVFNDNTGEFEAWVWDDPDEFNRYWLARNSRELNIVVDDERLAKQIELLENKEYRIPQTRKEQLLVERRKIERELRNIEKDELAIEEQEKRDKEKRRKKAEMKSDEVKEKVEKTRVNEVSQPVFNDLKEGV